MSDIQSSLNLENNARNRESDLVKDTLKAIENFQYLLKTLHSEIQHALRNQYQKTFLSWDSLHESLKKHCEAWSYKKIKHKKIKTYRKSV